MKKILIPLILTILYATIAHASDWKYVNGIYIDTESINISNNNTQVSYWSMIKNDEKKFSKLQIKIFESIMGEPIDKVLIKRLFDCSNQKTRQESQYIYFKNSFPNYTQIDNNWQDIPPDSMLFDHYKFVCSEILKRNNDK